MRNLLNSVEYTNKVWNALRSMQSASLNAHFRLLATVNRNVQRQKV
jgi:hypothetical protein